jgi:hypothetical protein
VILTTNTITADWELRDLIERIELAFAALDEGKRVVERFDSTPVPSKVFATSVLNEAATYLIRVREENHRS